MPSPQAVVTFVAFLFLLLMGLHVGFDMPPVPSAAASVLVAFGAGWIVNRRVPDEDDDVTEDARNETSRNGSGHSASSSPPQPEPDA